MQIISEAEAMDYPRFDEQGEILEEVVASMRTVHVYENREDENIDSSDRSDAMLFDDLFDDCLDYARSAEEGWFYPDEDRDPWDDDPEWCGRAVVAG